MRIALLVMAIATAGCHADFIDLRPQSERNPPDMADPADLAPAPPDLTGLDLYGVDFSGVDFSTPPDLAQPPTEGVFAQGTFSGRAGHSAAGTAQLVRLGDGSVELRFLADFTSTGVPGPYVVLTSRDTIGTAIDASKGDLDLGVLKSSSGAQSYPVPGGDGGRRYAFVYCKPFGVEVGRAPLSP